jgi:hypothetical protein
VDFFSKDRLFLKKTDSFKETDRTFSFYIFTIFALSCFDSFLVVTCFLEHKDDIFLSVSALSLDYVHCRCTPFPNFLFIGMFYWYFVIGTASLLVFCYVTVLLLNNF